MSSTTWVNLVSGRMSLRLFAVAAWIMLALLPLRAEPVDLDFQAAEIDLLPLVEAVRKPFQQDTVELPATDTTPARTIVLNGRGPGPLYRWAVFTLHNPTSQPREMVVAAPHQRFVGSRVLWPLPEGSRVVGLTTSDGEPVTPLPSLGADAFALTVAPGATTSYALEVSATGLDRLSLWHRGAFHVVADRYAFFRGLVLGISILLGIGFVCLFIVRPQAMFPAAALFAWSAIGFLIIETGYLPTILAKVPALAGSGQSLRALVEGLMLAGVIAMPVTFLDLRRWMPRAAMALMAGGVVAVVLTLYGLFDPRTAIGLIRIAFALAVGAGLGIMVVLWRRGAARAQASLFGWLVLAGWTVAAGIGALELLGPAVMQPLISAGLVLVLVTLGFTLAQLAFGLGAVSGEAFEEAGRRALALAASDQAVWDWQVDQGRFHVGPEIERALGLEEGACENTAGWRGLIHPADRVAYDGAVEAAERRGRGSFSQEFRLRRSDGNFRWYELRARAIPGGKTGASRLIGTLADVTMLRRSEDRLLADAVRDRLTGLPNRALFLDRLEQAMSRARHVASPDLYVIALDLDRFKSFNDGLGEEAGDYLLQTVGRRLQACVGPADTVARLPGHKFGIIWDASRHGFGITDLTGAITASVAEPIYLPAGEVVLTASMGVAPVDGEVRGAEAVLKAAEVALYEAMRQGYGAVEFFRADMHDERSELLQLEQNLRHALERDEIEVVYQPILRLDDRKLAGFEALMRWRRGDVVLEPDSFVGLAEETGIIREIGRYVLKEACRRLGTWQRAFRPHDPLFVAVNISSVQLLNNDLVEDIQRLIEREDLQPGTLKLELTESLVVENPELARKLLMRLKQIGAALACDDFGTGYSGLESVFRLPFDTVKIDRVFLEAESGDRNWTMVEAMLRLARDLGLEVVAEGIETDDQLERLSGLGCDFGQGYLIGPPVSAQQVVAALGGRGSGAGAGLAAFWTRLTGTAPEDAEAESRAPRIRPPSQAAAGAPEHVEEPIEEAAPEPLSPDPLSPEPVEDDGVEHVIDWRRVVPAAKPAAPAAPKPAAPAAPKVGSAPFAPRRVKLPEPEPAESGSSELKFPEIEPPQAEAVPASEPEAVEPEHIEAVVQENEEPRAPAASPTRAKRTKHKGKTNKASADAAGRKPSRGSKPVSSRSARSKGTARKDGPVKAAPPKDAPAKKAAGNKAAAKSAPAKSAPAKSAPAKSAPAKSAPAKNAPAKSARAKSGPAQRGAAKRGKPKRAQAKSAPATQ